MNFYDLLKKTIKLLEAKKKWVCLVQVEEKSRKIEDMIVK